MALLIEFDGKKPQIGRDVFLAPTAVLIGAVHVEDNASIWFGAVLRADFGPIFIGAGSSIQDNAVVHSQADFPTRVGRNVTVGHNATIEGCMIGDNSLIGIGAVVLQYTEIGERVLIAANSVVLEHSQIPPRSLVAGAPAKVKKELSGRALEWTEFAVKDYHEIHARYRAQGVDQLRPLGE